MKRSHFRQICFVLILLAPAFAAGRMMPPRQAGGQQAGAVGDSLDPTSFVSTLRSVRAALAEKDISLEKIAEIREGLPARWRVDTDGRIYEISSRPLRTLLESAERDAAQRKARVQEALDWLDSLAEQVESYERKEKPNEAAARSALDKILRRAEFGGVQKESALEKLREWIYFWLYRVLERLFGAINRHPIGGKILFWLVVVAAVVWLATMLFRYWTGRGRLEEMQKLSAVAATLTWQEWIRAAREAAGRGDFREAVHAVYWAGIAQLEDRGVVPRDRTHTPREYLRQLSDAASASVIAPPGQKETLAELTSCLERVWYGRRAATQDDFRASLQQAEALGCRLQ